MKRKFTSLFVAWTLIVCFLSLIPGSQIPSPKFFDSIPIDKLVHLCLYFIMYILMFLSIVKENIVKFGREGVEWKVGILVVIIGCILEILQSCLTTGRYFDIFDILANMLGVGIAALLVYFKQNKF